MDMIGLWLVAILNPDSLFFESNEELSLELENLRTSSWQRDKTICLSINDDDRNIKMMFICIADACKRETWY